MTKEDIINYYRDCKKDYKLIWRLEKVWGVHYGYFDKGDKSLSQAILKMNDQVLKNADINEKSLVLDAGCGYAGTAMYIANKRKLYRVVIIFKLNIGKTIFNYLIYFESLEKSSLFMI